MLELEYILRFNESLLNIAAFLIHPKEPPLSPPLELTLPIRHPYLQVHQLMPRHLPLKRQHLLNPLRLIHYQSLIDVHLCVLIRGNCEVIEI